MGDRLFSRLYWVLLTLLGSRNSRAHKIPFNTPKIIQSAHRRNHFIESRTATERDAPIVSHEAIPVTPVPLTLTVLLPQTSRSVFLILSPSRLSQGTRPNYRSTANIVPFQYTSISVNPQSWPTIDLIATYQSHLEVTKKISGSVQSQTIISQYRNQGWLH